MSAAPTPGVPGLDRRQNVPDVSSFFISVFWVEGANHSLCLDPGKVDKCVVGIERTNSYDFEGLSHRIWLTENALWRCCLGIIGTESTPRGP